MSRLFLLAVAVWVAPSAVAQSASALQAQVERQLRTNLEARGLAAADIDYVIGCTVHDEAPADVPCTDERIAQLLMGPEAVPPRVPPPPAAPPVPPPPPVQSAPPAPSDVRDTSTASVLMDGVAAYTFEGRSYHTRVSDDFAVLALVSSPLVDGSFAVPDDAPFSFVEVRLFDGLTVGVQTNPRGIALYHWGPGGTRVDGPNYFVKEATVEVTRIEDGVAYGTVTLLTEAVDDDTPPGEGVRHTLVATFEAVAGRIPSP